MNKFEKPTLNWHFTTTCNFSCRYCFIASAKNLDLESYEIALEKIAPYFSRINFVGGEPTVSPHLFPLMHKTKCLGLDCTIVTNGFNLIHKESDFEELYDLCSTIGISIDSLCDDTNKKIGRCCRNNVITAKEYENLCHKIKAHNIKLKINTVVSSLNKYEDFSQFYKKTNPDRIKLFQVLKPNYCLNRNYDEFLITKHEFQNFVLRHKLFIDKIVAEDNEAMRGSYYMLDSACRFINDITGVKSPSLVQDDISTDTALPYISVDREKYLLRYSA